MRTFAWLGGTTAAALILGAAGQVQAAEKQVDKVASLPSFSRDLVDKVEKSAIYIWIFQPDDMGWQQGAGIGSGVIIQAVPEENAAYAITNHHVAGTASLLQCEAWDNSTYKATMVATEPGIDVALIRIENIPPDKYEVAVMGRSADVQIGEPALAIGAPGSYDSLNSDRSNPMMSFGLFKTTTMRVISGKQTDPLGFVNDWSGWRLDLGYEVMTNMPWRFMVQSAINGGNSGGPLFNARGELIGLNHAGYPALVGFTQNENYTVPIDFARNFVNQVLNNQSYDIPWFGMDMFVPPGYTDSQAISHFIERIYDPKELKIIDVREGSPAERAGLQRDDRILEFDGQIFPDVTALRLYIFELPIGKQVPVLVRRGREKLSFSMEVAPKRSYNSEFSM